MSKKGGFSDLLFTSIMPKIYGIGASIVIVGAMFKILHLPGAGIMLGVGLTTEAIIFFLSAFEPKHSDPDWTKVYPELAEDYSDGVVKTRKGTAEQLDSMLAKAEVDPELVKRLGYGLRSIADTTKKLSDMSDASVATTEYATNARAASKTLGEVNKSFASAAEAGQGMAEASKGTKEYQQQIQNVTKNLNALNVVYESELKDASSHTKALNKFYTNVSEALEGMAQAGKETSLFQAELNKLTSHVSALNKVYGNMLNAMRTTE